VIATTTTTVPNPCVGQVCTTEPPSAVLSAASGQITADRGGYCWRDPVGPLTGCLALARPLNYTPPTLVVTQGDTVTVQFNSSPALTPLQVSLLADGDRGTLAATNPTRFRVDLAPGVYENSGLLVRWLQGEVPYGFRLDVRRAATPAVPTPTGTLTLTG
jgi:hypothetical protein